jgi:hypothetical protein
MKRILIACTVVLSLWSCESHSGSGSTSSSSPAKIKFINSSKKTFNVYIDGSVVGSVSPKSSSSFDTYPGSHSVKAIEEVGRLLGQRIREDQVSAVQGETVDWIFP